MLPFVWGAGGDLFDKTVTDCSDDVLIADIKKNAFTSPFTFQKVDDIMRYFSRNKVAMMMGSAATILSLQKIGGCDFAVAPFPGTAKVPAVKVYKSGSSAEDPFFHDWSFPENGNFGGVFWCRGNSWYVSSVIDFIEIMDQDLDAGVRDFLLDTCRAQVTALSALQDASGLWRTVLDDPGSYTETSGSAGIAYGILKGIRLGLLDPRHQAIAESAVQAILSNIAEDGTVKQVSAGTGMGMDRDHYRNIIIAPMAYGQSLTIMALAEYLRSALP